jgi:hypothetical protein
MTMGVPKECSLRMIGGHCKVIAKARCTFIGGFGLETRRKTNTEVELDV